jgi:adenylosuccinate lyase
MLRPDAQALVSACAARAQHEGRSLVDVLREHMAQVAPGNRVAWAVLAEPKNHLGQANTLIDRVLARLANITH